MNKGWLFLLASSVVVVSTGVYMKQKFPDGNNEHLSTAGSCNILERKSTQKESQEELSADKYAKIFAKGANLGFEKYNSENDLLVSRYAYSKGGHIIYDYTLRVDSIVDTDFDLHGDKIPQTCKIMTRFKRFNSGELDISYRFLNSSGEVLDNIFINNKVCDSF